MQNLFIVRFPGAVIYGAALISAQDGAVAIGMCRESFAQYIHGEGITYERVAGATADQPVCVLIESGDM